MKKQSFKNLKLQKRTISKMTNYAIGGLRYHTYTCYTQQICPIDADTSEPLNPIPVGSWGSCNTCHTDFFC